MNYILFDDPDTRVNLLPLTFTRPVADIRIGIFKIYEKWEKRLHAKVSFQTETYLQKKFSLHPSEDTVYINGSFCPSTDLIGEVQGLSDGQVLKSQGIVVAYRNSITANKKEISFTGSWISNTWNIFQYNGQEIKNDFELIQKSGKSIGIADTHTIVYNPENIFVEEGATIRAAVLNAENGPIYIGKNAEIQEGAVIRGPFALCESSVVNMGAKMRGDNTIGPFSKVGGEVSNSVIFGYSNKAHDGFMGNSVIGEWCNFGADSNTSNLKNNYSGIKVYSYKNKNFADSGKMFCGLVMGDHSKCGINTMFDSGTVIGVNVSIFGTKYTPKFIPSFSWGDIDDLSTFKFDKAIDVAERVFARRNMELSEIDKEILLEVYKAESKS